MAKNQASHHAPDEPKSRALTLRAEGYSVPVIAGMVDHSERTVWRWLARGRDVALNEETPGMMDDWMRIVRRSQGMQHAVLDIVEDMAAIHQDEDADEGARVAAAKELMKHGLLLNIYAGTASDKLQKQSGPELHAQTITINFISQPPPDIIEGEVV